MLRTIGIAFALSLTVAHSQRGDALTSINHAKRPSSVKSHSASLLQSMSTVGESPGVSDSSKQTGSDDTKARVEALMQQVKSNIASRKTQRKNTDKKAVKVESDKVGESSVAQSSSHSKHSSATSEDQSLASDMEKYLKAGETSHKAAHDLSPVAKQEDETTSSKAISQLQESEADTTDSRSEQEVDWGRGSGTYKKRGFDVDSWMQTFMKKDTKGNMEHSESTSRVEASDQYASSFGKRRQQDSTDVSAAKRQPSMSSWVETSPFSGGKATSPALPSELSRTGSEKKRSAKVTQVTQSMVERKKKDNSKDRQRHQMKLLAQQRHTRASSKSRHKAHSRKYSRHGKSHHSRR